MKYRYVAVAASVASGVSAQQPPAYTGPVSSAPVAPVSSAPTSYTTVTYDDCPSQSIETLITVTNGVTVTYCPECQHSISATKPAPSHTTVYTTVYQSLCSTGLVPVTYTVTEECAEPTPTWATGTAKHDHVPQGFTVTVKDCHVCDKTPVPVTITEPCKDGCGKPSTPPPTGAPTPPPSGDKPNGGNVEQIPDGQIQAPGPSGGAGSPAPSGGAGYPSPSGGASNPGSGSPDGGAQRPPAGGDSKCTGPSCPTGGDSGSPPGDKPAGDKPSGDQPSGDKPAPGASAGTGDAVPYPTPTSGDVGSKCPGPDCHAQPSSGSGNNGNSSDVTPEPYSGGANALSFGFVSSLGMAAVVAALAFAL